MSKIRSFSVFVCVLLAASAWGAGFQDDFNRPNGAVGNGWTIQTNGTIKVEIVDNEVLVAGTQATDWVRCGVSRPVTGETRVSFDFKADASFNVHVQVGAADSSAFVEVYAYPGGPMTYANSADGSWPGWTEITGSNMVAGAYNTLTLQQDGQVFAIILNGEEVGTVTNTGFTTIDNVLISSDAAANTTGTLHIDNVVIGEIIAGTAKDPSPAPGAVDVPREVVLGWTAAKSAVGHNVYFGTVATDVNDASVGDPRGVLASQGQTGVAFDPDGLLEYGQTYYWKIDEVNGTPDNAIIKGDVWSFTVEPFTYALGNVTATASSAQVGMGAQNTVNGSGLNASDQHSTELTEMWMSAGVQPNWIQYEFDNVYKLDELWVWNSNQLIEAFVGFGAKDVTIEYSADGETWTTLDGAPEFARATGSASYTPNTIVDFGGAMAKFVKLTINQTWGGIAPQASLAEVRFYYIPVQAREPQPAVAAMDVSVDTDLSWRPGREAESHEVFLGTDASALALVDTVDGPSATPGTLDFGTTYYWKVNEVGGTGPFEGEVWSFTTQEYATIEDMESYNDDDHRIYDAWVDGLTDTAKGGSQVGYDVSPFAEMSIVHGGLQAMPLMYDNSAAPFLSEAERTFDSPQNWTAGGADTLSLYVQGSMPAFVETASGNVLMNAIGTDIWDTADQFRFAYKTLNGNGSMVARVESLFNSNAWAKGGVMIRQGIEPGSMHAFMAITPGGAGAGNGASFQRRLATSGASTNNDSTTLVGAPYWVKIERNGNNFTGSISPDGQTWTALGTPQTITMTGPVLVGLALTSHDAGVATGAEFSNIATTGNVSGAWQVAEIGAAQPAGNSAEGLYVTIKDNSGKSKTVMNPDAAATVRAGWTQWTIPLSEFTSAGVKMNAVKSMTIGVGNKTAPAKGGAGKLFIDDIGYGRPLP